MVGPFPNQSMRGDQSPHTLGLLSPGLSDSRARAVPPAASLPASSSRLWVPPEVGTSAGVGNLQSAAVLSHPPPPVLLNVSHWRKSS